MDDLIARLEAAEEGSRGLDNEIAHAVGAFFPEDPVCFPPYYTTSLDAALTLVPVGFEVTLRFNGVVYPRAGLSECSAHLTKGGRQYPSQVMDCEARTPALALCIASLRARMAGAVSPADAE